MLCLIFMATLVLLFYVYSLCGNAQFVLCVFLLSVWLLITTRKLASFKERLTGQIKFARSNKVWKSHI